METITLGLDHHILGHLQGYMEVVGQIKVDIQKYCQLVQTQLL